MREFRVGAKRKEFVRPAVRLDGVSGVLNAFSSSQPRNFAAVPISPGVTKNVAEIPCSARSGAAFRYCDRSPSSKVI